MPEEIFNNCSMAYIKGLGRMFYIIPPQDTFHENVEDVPNYYIQSWPYFFTFMILEHIIRRMQGKTGIRLNDSITSLSNGLLAECGRLCWRGAESYTYTWVYTNWRILDLPWNSTVTWILAALGMDFCYYWMHRACHEVHILWAQHQVHHTSEDFNMGVGIRQSILQGWCGFLFYLPLATVIPPAQFVMHHQFSYLYMFWIHTETVSSLGPLEYVLNTPSHHRVHHGSNPYCIDVNYGGVLIIWDKIFGTFKAESKTMKIVYGLIYNQPSFNPLHLQTFYTRYVVVKFRSFNNWRDKFLAIFYLPSWAPGVTKRFKDMEEDAAILTRKKYDVVLPLWCNIYLMTHYSVVLYGFYLLFLQHLYLSPISVLFIAGYIIASLTVFGILLDMSPNAALLEMGRCASMLVLLSYLVPLSMARTTLQIIYILSGIFWLLNHTRIVKFVGNKNE